jgi:hypothetical protein
MLQIRNTILHLDIIQKKFVCDISKCKGFCCVDGDSGAPLTKQENQKIIDLLPKIIDNLIPEAQNEIHKKGVSCVDFDNELTTMTIGISGPCVFTKYKENGEAFCAIEEAYNKGLTDFQKPISCHLYPIRIKEYPSFHAINYHKWEICEDAICKGERLSVPIYIFLKEALIKKYGDDWYNELCIAAEELLKEK